MQKLILRAAVNGTSRQELADNLIAIAKKFKEQQEFDVSTDNCIGDDEGEHGFFSFDYQVDPQEDGEPVVIYKFSADD